MSGEFLLKERPRCQLSVTKTTREQPAANHHHPGSVLLKLLPELLARVADDLLLGRSKDQEVVEEPGGLHQAHAVKSIVAVRLHIDALHMTGELMTTQAVEISSEGVGELRIPHLTIGFSHIQRQKDQREGKSGGSQNANHSALA